ncbi:hypothetical protein BJ165DRAFT_1398839 [Panaeolus papilionaceus]|nr:hypothetical protein BJ165DRAFT_1398839 [Panaeolus papilionaceus]
MLASAAPQFTLTEAEPSWKTASPGHVPSPKYNPAYKYVEYSRALTHQITTQWIPHVLSFQERLFCLNQTRSLVQRINNLEQRRFLKDPRVEHEYTLTRIQYSVRFGRAFRINDLPTEVLTTILRLACWSADTPTQHTLWRLWLTGTCPRFRSVMIADPTLWTAVVYHNVSQLQQAITYMKRAGSLPFDIRIGEGKEFMKIQDIIPLFEELWKKISQLRTLIVVVHDWDPIIHIVNQLARVYVERVPLILEHLEIHRTGPYYVQSGAAFPEEAYDKPPPLFGGALIPTMRIVALDAIHTDWQRTRLCNLTTLDIRKLPFARSPTNDQFKDLLRSNPGLKKLLMDGAGPLWPLDPNVAATSHPVVLHELEQLILGDFSLLYGVHLLSLFRTPNLTDLTLLNTCGDDQPEFFEALRPLSANVRILSLFKCESTLSVGMSTSIVKWLKTMKHLGYLRICDVNEHFLNLFMYNPVTLTPYAAPEATHGVLCPKLAIFEMQRAPAERILHFTKWRAALGAPLQKIYVPVWMRHTITPEQSKDLMEALGPGEKLRVLFGRSDEEDVYRKALSNQTRVQAANLQGPTQG